MAASALLDEMRVRERTTLEGGCSALQPNCWISYNRKAIWLEDHSGFGEAMRAAGTDKQAWRRIRPEILEKVTWAEAAAHGAALPSSLREELDTLRRTQRAEDRSWSEFSTAGRRTRRIHGRIQAQKGSSPQRTPPPSSERGPIFRLSTSVLAGTVS